MKPNNAILKIIIGLVFAIGIFISFSGKSYAATFTVDSTGDAADAGIDGLCATASAVCTLRAAIEEASAAGGPHTIAFNIPNTDPGYVDFDGGAGDSNGDDYWVITPSTVLPTITSSDVTIDGATQTANQGNQNTSGPEIVIDGHTAGEVRGLYFTGTNGSVNSLTLYRFGSTSAAIEVTGDGFTLTNSYLGPFATGVTGASGSDRSQYGIYFNVASGTVGTSTSDGNVLSGNSLYGIIASCGTGGSGETINIAGNKIGITSLGTSALANGNSGIYLANDCISIIGGDLATNRNYVGGNGINGMTLDLGSSSVPLVEIYNNYFGTSVDGGTVISNVTRQIQTQGSAYTGNTITVIVGAEDKGNLFRGSTTAGIDFLTGGIREVEIAYNTISNISGNPGGLGLTNNGAIRIGGAGTFELTKVHHNYVGIFTPDPYFGINTGAVNTIHLGAAAPSAEVYNNEFSAGGTPSTFSAVLSIHSSANIYLHHNIIRDYPVASSSITIVTSAYGLIFSNNQVYNNANFGIQLRDATAENMLLENNTFYNNTTANVRLASGGGLMKSAKLRGNTFYSNIVPISNAAGRANDIGDVDTGPNNKQNWMVLNSVEYLGAGQYRVAGTLDGKVIEGPFEIEVCEADNSYSGNAGGCIDSLGVFNKGATPDQISGSSNFYFVSVDVQTQYSDRQANIELTTLTTNSLNMTSEFSDNFVCTDDIVCPDAVFDVLDLIDPIGGETITDTTPLLNWDESQMSDGTINPEVDHYDVIIDNTVVASVSGNITQYQTTTEVAEGSHTWQVIAYREGNEVTGTSLEETFVVDAPEPEPEPEETFSFVLEDPINGKVINDTTPLLNWQDLDPESELDFYDLYINNKFVKNTGTTSEYQISDDQALAYGTYNWQVIAYKYVDEVATEISRSTIETFVIEPEGTTEEPPVVEPPTTGEEPEPTKPKPTPTKPNLPEFLNIQEFEEKTLAPLGGILAVATTVSLSIVLISLGKDIAEKLGLLLGGILPKTKKHWGIIFDIKKSQGIAFAVVRVYDEENKLIHTIVSDLDGRYGASLDKAGKYRVEVKAKGYKHFSKEINVTNINNPELILDVGLERTASGLNPLFRYFFYYLPEIVQTVRLLIITLMVGGFLYSLYIFMQSPVILNLIILLLYLGLFLLNLYSEYKNRLNVEGRVVELATHTGLPAATIILYDNQGNQVDVRLTNKRGIAKLKAKPANYKVQAQKNGYEMGEVEANSKSIELKVDPRGYLDKAIFMKKHKI